MSREQREGGGKRMFKISNQNQTKEKEGEGVGESGNRRIYILHLCVRITI